MEGVQRTGRFPWSTLGHLLGDLAHEGRRSEREAGQYQEHTLREELAIEDVDKLLQGKQWSVTCIEDNGDPPAQPRLKQEPPRLSLPLSPASSNTAACPAISSPSQPEHGLGSS